MKKILVLGVFLLAGCGEKSYTCSSEDTTRILSQALEENEGISPDVKIRNIRTESINDKLKLSSCQADIQFYYKSMGEKEQFARVIGYTTQETDDGKSIYVSYRKLKVILPK